MSASSGISILINSVKCGRDSFSISYQNSITKTPFLLKDELSFFSQYAELT